MGEAQVRDLWWRITKIKWQQGWCQPIQSCTATLDIGREDPWFLLPIAREVFPFPFYWYTVYVYIYIYMCIIIYYIYTDANGTIAHKFPQHLHWPGISWLCWAAVAILLGLQSSESSWRTSVFRGELCFGLGLLPWNHVESMDSSLSMARNLNWRYLPYIRIKRPT